MTMSIETLTWENLGQVAVLGSILALFMQLIGKGLIELLLCLILRGLFKMSNEQAKAWPGRSPIYFAFMLTVGFLLLLWRGLEPGPALITSVVAMFIASGEYEALKSTFRASGKKIVPFGYKQHCSSQPCGPPRS